ncbi:MAG: radical SAM protein [Candidatus Wallbacteria bacterium]|nr:radical SAM protein [Candidatus Wallbacteria bacterium]
MNDLAAKLNCTFPPYLTIEISNVCNFQCPMCTLHEKDALPPTYMKPETFESIVRQIYSTDLKLADLRLFWAGEPMLHPQFSEFLNLLSGHESRAPKKITVAFDTNASHLAEFTDVLIECGENLHLSLIVSMDALTEGTYNKIRVNGDFQKVQQSVLELLDQKRGHKFPRVAVQFIVMPENASELQDFVAFWRQKFAERKLSFSLMLNSSLAEHDGVNLRPLTEQNLPANQKEANRFYLKALKQAKIIEKMDWGLVESQGGGRYEEK